MPASKSIAFALQVQNLTKKYPRPEGIVQVLNGVSFSIKPAEWVNITGKSGCGKTTLLHILGTLDRADSGKLIYFDEEISHLGAFRLARWRRKTIGFIFQSYQLLPELNAEENVSLAGRINGLSTAVAKKQARSLLDRVDLSHRLHHRPAELSGGEQQRIAIARALINQPRVILADEPTGNLDADSSHEIMTLLEALRRTEQITIIMATHERSVDQLPGRRLCLENGELSE